MKIPSLQGDWRYLELQEQIFAGTGANVDVSQNPDLVPPLAAAAALAAGRTTVFANAGRLRIKESDRLHSVTAVLSALGAEIEEGPDFLTIRGKKTLAGGVTVDAFNDHRIAMMTAVAAIRCEKPVTLTGAGSVSKSYPNFWEEYARLGGKIREVSG
jgi:3-phosphoshikimate 1-carboxyvinyltransferase